MVEAASTNDNFEIIDILNDIRENTVSTNNGINDLQEYLIIQEKKREDERQAQTDKEYMDAEQDAKVQAEQSARTASQDEVYTELLTDIRSELQLNNQMLAGQFLFFGIIAGILLFKILWDKLT